LLNFNRREDWSEKPSLKKDDRDSASGSTNRQQNL